MRSSEKDVLAGVLPALAASALLLGGCSDSSPTEPKLSTSTPTPAPPLGNITGPWTGTYSYDDVVDDCVFSVPAQATFEQDGSAVRGTLSASGPCRSLGIRSFAGTLRGNTLIGTTSVGGVEAFGYVQGKLSGSSLEIDLGINPYGYASDGTLHLHR